jgi:hypothetical protein
MPAVASLPGSLPEGTITAMDSLQRYVTRYGIPLAVYADKHTTYQSPAEPTVDEPLAGTKPLSQVGRALSEFGVELTAAHSPQAKGRVERLFKTFQDRLIKELRLSRGATIEAANQFMERYLPRYNWRFASAQAQPADLHRLTPSARELDGSLCLKTTRSLRKDFTIAHAGQRYQLHNTIRARHVLVEQRRNGALRLMHQGRLLDFHAIAVRPGSVTEAKPRPCSHRPVTPTPNHPWRTLWRQERGQHKP